MILILIFAEVLGKLLPEQTFLCNVSQLADQNRSVRSHCCPSHELQGHSRYCLPVSGVRKCLGGDPTNCTYQQEALFLAWIDKHMAPSDMAYSISPPGMCAGYLERRQNMISWRIGRMGNPSGGCLCTLAADEAWPRMVSL
jgi:hypothetical protein